MFAFMQTRFRETICMKTILFLIRSITIYDCSGNTNTNRRLFLCFFVYSYDGVDRVNGVLFQINLTSISQVALPST